MLLAYLGTGWRRLFLSHPCSLDLEFVLEARKPALRFLPPLTVNSQLQLFISEEINIVCVTKRLARAAEATRV